jgi:hypothetical protein
MPGPSKKVNPTIKKTAKSKKIEHAKEHTKERKRHREHVKEIQTNIKKHGNPDKTTKGYDGHIRRGQEFVKQYATEQAELEAKWKEKERDRRAATGMDGNDDDDDYDEEEALNAKLPSEFATCLDGAPVECTPSAIVTFLHEKCFTQDKGKSTASQIHAAFLRHYDRL